MKQRLFRTLFVVLAIVVMVSMTASAAATTKSLSSNFTLVNLGDGTATVTIDYIKPDGTTWSGSSVTSAELAPSGGQLIVRQYNDTLTAGKGSVVVSSSQPLGALVQVITRGAQVPTSGAYSGFTSGSQVAYVPMVAKNGGSATGTANTQLMLQNTGTASATFDVSFYQGSATPVATRQFPNVAAGATYYYDLNDDAELANGYYSVKVDAGAGQVAVVSNLFFGADSLMTFNGFSADKVDSNWYIPLLYIRLTNTLTTSLVVQNLDTVEIPANDIKMVCSKDAALGADRPATLDVTWPNAVAVNATAQINTLTNTTLFPASYTNWFGGCKVSSTSGKKMVAFVMYRWVNAGDQAAYEAIPASATDKTLFVPLIAKQLGNGFSTAATIQNLSETQEATVTITYTASPDFKVNGVVPAPVVRTGVKIPAGSSYIRNFRQATTEGTDIPVGWFGTMQVVSDTPIQAYVANTTTNTLGGDQFMAYLGFTLP